MRAKLREIAELSRSNPRSAVLNSVGDYSIFRPLRYRVLVGCYVRPEKTAGGIILADQTLQEDRFQGKVGLLLSVGPLAFSDDEQWNGVKPKLYDWVVYNPSDAWEFFFVDPGSSTKATSCRLMDDVNIKGILEDPSRVW